MTFMLSDHNVTCLISISRVLQILDVSFKPSVAASSSSLGILVDYVGATRLFAATKRTVTPSFSYSHLKYVTAPCAIDDASTNV